MRTLISLDGSIASEAILSWIPCLLSGPGAAVRLVHVVPYTADAAHSVGGRKVPCERYVAELAAASPAWGGRVETVSPQGHPALGIIRQAQDFRADLVAMRTRSRAGLERVLMGSVAAEVMETLTQPLMAFGHSLTPPEGEPKVRRILVPVEASPRTMPLLDKVPAFAKFFGAEVRLLHVSAPGGADLPEWTAKLESAGVKAEGQVIGGDPRTDIAPHAASWEADLILMRTAGRSGFQRLLMGSIAEEVVRRASCPVILVRPD